MKKCAESARAILQAVFILLSSSYEITLYSPYINMVRLACASLSVPPLKEALSQTSTYPSFSLFHTSLFSSLPSENRYGPSQVVRSSANLPLRR
jgi:hypothetical protein